MMKSYNDFAIPLAWPDKTAYGDEKWMAFLKRCGIVKNLNFKVGHAAILLISQHNGIVEYFDFGRYVSPRGFGRARSRHFDPRLRMQVRATFDVFRKQILNIEAIVAELATLEHATHGGGRLLFSVAPNINFDEASAYAHSLVTTGPVPYGAIAADNNSCSRFVAQVLIAGMRRGDPRIRKIKYSETLKPSPTGNIVNTRQDGHIFCYLDGTLSKWKMNRLSSLKFQWKLLRENLSHKHTGMLGNDNGKGCLSPPLRTPGIPVDSQWLGGIGEGMWFHISACPAEEEHYIIRSYSDQGELINQVRTVCPQKTFILGSPFEISMQLDGLYFTIIQYETKYLFKKVERIQKNISLKVI